MNNLHTLELILTLDSKSLGKVSSTCKDWHMTTCESRFREKMKYIQETSLMFQDTLIQEFDYQMYKCVTGYDDNTRLNLERQDSTSGTSNGFFPSWRDYTDDWEESWYEVRSTMNDGES
mgnify:CR=1 FL=1